MRISDILTICLRNLTRRKIRTALTIVGVVIGVCAIILMVSLGIGARASMEQMLQEWGDLTVISVYNYGKTGRDSELDNEAVLQIQSLPGVDIATPFYQIPTEVRLESRNGRYSTCAQIVGIYPQAVQKLGYELTDGTYLEEGDRPYSLVVGSGVQWHFQDTGRKNGAFREPVDAAGNPQKPYVDIMKDRLSLVLVSYDEKGERQTRIQPHVSGVMKEDWNKGWETSECVFIDVREAQDLYRLASREQGGARRRQPDFSYDEVRVKCTDVKLVSGVQQSIADMGFECSSMEDSREYFNKQLNQVQSMLGGLAGISLLVAAIGIANTMVMSIYERTREIGIMKVIGAEIPDIRAMFLTESAMIGLIGGIVGVGLSFLLSRLMNGAGAVGALLGQIGLNFGMDGKVSVIPWWLVLLAMAFSMLVGVVFGFIPANRAMKISALEAIRHD